MSPQAPLIGVADSLQPDPLIESWSVYELSDGSRIRAKLVPMRIVGQPERPEVGPVPVNLAGSVQLSVASPKEMYGKPEALTGPQIGAAPKKQVQLRAVDEPWNFYRLGETNVAPRYLKVRLTIVAAYRVIDHFDMEGVPLYNVQTGVVAGPATREEVENGWRALMGDAQT